MFSGIGFATVLMFACMMGFSITRVFMFLVLGIAIGIYELSHAMKIAKELKDEPIYDEEED